MTAWIEGLAPLDHYWEGVLDGKDEDTSGGTGEGAATGPAQQ